MATVVKSATLPFYFKIIEKFSFHVLFSYASFFPLVRRKIILVLSICVWNVKKLRVLLSIINALGESNDFKISVNYDLKLSINYNKDFLTQ